MERRHKSGPRVVASRLDPTDYEASPFVPYRDPITGCL